MILNLTDISIKQFPHPATGQVRVFDARLSAFGFTAGTRTKTFFVMKGKPRQLIVIGRYPEVSLQEARKDAKRILAAEAPKRGAMSLTAATTAYLADAQPRLRPATYSEYARYLKLVSDKPLADLTKQDIGTTEAHAVMAWKVFCNWCIKNEYMDRNPFQHVPATYNQRSRFLTDDEIKAVWQYDHPPYSDIVKLCLLTGQRVGEVTAFNSTWLTGDTITIPASVAKNRREHTIPFNLLTAQYLQRYIGQTFNGFSKAKKRMDEKTGISGYTVHDIRRTFSTIHAKIGTPVHVTEKMLNHQTGSISGVAAIYNRHTYLKEMRTASLLYEQHIAKLVGA